MHRKLKKTHKNIFKNLWLKTALFGLGLWAFIAAGGYLPYERCDRSHVVFNFDRAHGGSFCSSCGRFSLLPSKNESVHEAVKIENPALSFSHIPPVCFLAAALQTAHQETPASAYHQCSGVLNSAQRPCLTEHYMSETAASFNETAHCFGWTTLKDHARLFAFLNHNSNFILNKRDTKKYKFTEPFKMTTGCYGQINLDTIADIQTSIFHPSQPPYKEAHSIYQAVVKRCPFLKKTILPIPPVCEKPMAVYPFRSCLLLNQKESLHCRLAKDPSACLFYTLYSLKENEIKLKNRLKQNWLSQAALNSLSLKNKNIIEDFKFPIGLNEMLVVKGSITVKGQTKQVRYTMKSNTEVQQAFNKPHVQYNRQDLHIQKVNLFNEEELKWAVLFLAHNNSDFIEQHIPNFLKHVKRRIAARKGLNRVYKAYKQSLLKGQALNASALQVEFKKYLKNRRNDFRLEMPFLLTRLSKNLDYLSNKNDFLTEDIHKISKIHPWNSTQTELFIKQVKALCPLSLL